MKPKLGLMKRAGNALRKAAPVVLTCIGAVGVAATAILAVKATPKAVEMMKADSRKNHDGDPYAATKIEAIKSCWKCYVPAAATGVATIACIFGACVLNRKQQASIAGAYALLNRSFTNYKEKVKDIYGEEAHERIMESLAVENAANVHITGAGLVSNSCLEFEDADEEPRLFYDAFSERYFQTTVSKVLEAEYHLNRNFALMGGFVPLAMFYEFLGLEPLDGCSELGWWVSDEMYWIDFNHRKAMIDDGLNGEMECYIIEMVYTPTVEPPD